MESLDNQNNTDNNNNQNSVDTTQELKYKSSDNYVSVFNFDFLKTLQNKLTALFVNIMF